VPYIKIVEAAKRLRCDLIILGSHEHSRWRKFSLEASSKGWYASITCPVIVGPPHHVEVPANGLIGKGCDMKAE
jgi:nucleotide-binding universal stress UspA family protein